MASRKPLYTFQITGHATESNENKMYLLFVLVTHAINNIDNLMSFLN